MNTRLMLVGLSGLLMLSGCAYMKEQKAKEDAEFNHSTNTDTSYELYKKEDAPQTDNRYLLTDDEPSRTPR